jgi:hypothetical protein
VAARRALGARARPHVGLTSSGDERVSAGALYGGESRSRLRGGCCHAFRGDDLDRLLRRGSRYGGDSRSRRAALDDPVGFATPARDVDLQLLLGLGAQALGGVGSLRARGGEQLLACTAGTCDLLLRLAFGLGDNALALGARLGHDRRSLVARRDQDLRGRSVSARLVNESGALSRRRVLDRRSLLARRGQQPLGLPRFGIGTPPSAFERRSASSLAPSTPRASSASRSATARSRSSSCVRSCVSAWPMSVLVNHRLTRSRCRSTSSGS